VKKEDGVVEGCNKIKIMPRTDFFFLYIVIVVNAMFFDRFNVWCYKKLTRAKVRCDSFFHTCSSMVSIPVN